VKETGNENQCIASPHLLEKHSDRIRPDMLPLIQLEQQHIDWIVQTVPGGTKNVQDIYPLSPLQEGMLFHHVLNHERDPYILSTLLELQSQQQVEILVDGLQKVVDRHDALRSAVLWQNLPQPVQVVYRQVKLSAQTMELEPGTDAKQVLTERMRPGWGLDLRQAPLISLQVAASPDDERCYALLRVHHLVCDYRSLNLVIAEALAYVGGREHELPSPVSYRNYVAYVQKRANTEDAEAFFRRKLRDIDEPTALFGLLDVHTDVSQIEEARQLLAPAVARHARVLGRRMGISMARLFHAAWGLVVACASGRDDVVYGSVLMAGLQRNAPTTQRMLGMSVNTLPLRLRLQNVTARELVEQTHRELLELLDHEQASLTLAQQCSGIAPLFTAILNYRHSVSASTSNGGDACGIAILRTGEAWSNYPVALTVDDLESGFSLIAQADSRINPRRMIEYLQRALQSLLQALEHAPQTPALTLQVLPEGELRQVVNLFNATHAPVDQNELVHQLFESHADKTPDAVAVICGDRRLTYSQLNSRANQLARVLVARGVRPDERVGLYVERGVEMVIGLLGILKAGGAYVPLDLRYPIDRLAYMLRDSRPAAVLTQKHLQKQLPDAGVPVIALDGNYDEVGSHNLNASQLGLHSRNLAYVIYTSGSTGTPKGVMIEHRNLVNLIHWHCSAFKLDKKCRSSCVAAVGFDAATWEIWPSIATGATLVVAGPAVVADTEALLEWWANESLDISFLPTPMAELAFSRNIQHPTLRTLLVGGDRLVHRATSASFALVNNYGPTESTVVATSGDIQEADEVLHIGRPISNARVYILNGHLRPVPIGVVGELYIAGSGVARGYLNRPELTAQRFVPDLFSDEQEAKMYRTGDLGRWRADGTIEFIGRNDDQVKIRGQRIELGEIEAQVARHPQVAEVVVIAREDIAGEKRLVAYVTQRDAVGLDVEHLRAQLKSALPPYMVPGAIVVLQSLPLTPNGKIDRSALPVPEIGAYASGQYAHPKGKTENALAKIWQELLRVNRVGRDDNFFDLGGHSLLAMQVAVRIRSALAIKIPTRFVFELPTIKELGARIDDLRRTRLLDSIADGGSEIEDLLDKVASMPESQVEELMRALSAEGRL
jgi:amino acid adenylation domain-containing protein